MNAFSLMRAGFLAMAVVGTLAVAFEGTAPVDRSTAKQRPLLLAAAAEPAPAFTRLDAASWINSPPLMWSDLRGKVVLLDVWTFECWNCYRSFPWLHGVEARHATNDFQVIGIHSPEFDAEKVRSNIEAATKKYDVRFPVMIDNDHTYWNALGNSYWPAFYLIDKQGRIRARYVGETHDGDANAQRIEADMKALLAEPQAG